MSYDPHRSVSGSLTEVRTVLSRARNALAKIKRYEGVGIDIERGGKLVYPENSSHPGEDLPEMVEALRKTIAELEPWERT